MPAVGWAFEEQPIAVEDERDGLAIVGARDQDRRAPRGELDCCTLERAARRGAEVLPERGR